MRLRLLRASLLLLCAGPFATGCATGYLKNRATVYERCESLDSILVSEDGWMALEVEILYFMSDRDGGRVDKELARQKRCVVNDLQTLSEFAAEGPVSPRYAQGDKQPHPLEGFLVINVPRYEGHMYGTETPGWRLVPDDFLAPEMSEADLPPKFRKGATRYEPNERIPVVVDGESLYLEFDEPNADVPRRRRRKWWYKPARPFAIAYDVVATPIVVLACAPYVIYGITTKGLYPQDFNDSRHF
jgi:hypothetical protein